MANGYAATLFAFRIMEKVSATPRPLLLLSLYAIIYILFDICLEAYMKNVDQWLTKKTTKERYGVVFLLGFFIAIITLIPFIIIGKGTFLFYGDYNAQQIPFYNLVNDAVRSGQFGWSWYTDLGSDLLSSYSFYLMGSPFFWLSVILPRSMVTFSMSFLIALKYGFAALTSYIYIRKFVHGKTVALIGALLYAFSCFQSYNLVFNHFHDVTAFFPLMLIAMEESINNNRKGVFALTVGLMACINYYFFCGQVVFLILYYLFRMKCSDFNTSWKKFGSLCLEAVIGTALAAVILLPSFYGIINNPRVDNFLYGTDAFVYEDSTIIPRVIQAFFMPNDPPLYPNLFYKKDSGWLSISGYLPLFGMIGVITFMRTHRKHWATRFSYCLIIFAFIPVLNSLFQAANGTYYTRWFYMPILIFSMMTARIIDEDGVDIKPAIKFSSVVLTIFMVQSVMPYKFFDSLILFNVPYDFWYFWIGAAIALLSLILSYYLFKLKKHRKKYQIAMLLTTIVFCSGLILHTGIYCVNEMYKHMDNIAEQYGDSGINGRKNNYENVSENNFFRVNTMCYFYNYPMLWKLPSIEAFHSVVTPSVSEFYDSLGIERGVNSDPGLDKYTLRGLLSVKYFYLWKNATIPDVGDEQEKDDESSTDDKNAIYNTAEDKISVDIPKYLPGFEKVDENKYFEVFENKLYIPMGMGFDQYISEEKFTRNRSYTRDRILLKALVLSDEQIAKYSDILTETDDIKISELTKDDYCEYCKEKQQNCSDSFSFDSHGFISEIRLEKPQLVFFSVPYCDGWTAEVNGRKADIEKVSNGFMAVRAESGNNKIVFRYSTPGLKEGIMISGAALLLLAVYMLICRRFRGKEKEYGFAHSYDYKTQDDSSLEDEYINSVFAVADKSAETDKDKKDSGDS